MFPGNFSRDEESTVKSSTRALHLSRRKSYQSCKDSQTLHCHEFLFILKNLGAVPANEGRETWFLFSSQADKKPLLY